MNELYLEKVKLEPISHTYYHEDGRIFESFSRVLSTIKPKFESDYLSKLTAQKRGVSQEQILGEWSATAKVATDHGTRVHSALETYQKSAAIESDNEELRPMILAVNALYKDYYAVHQEKTLYDEEYEIAGTADTICVTTKAKNSICDLTDFKTGGKGIYFESKYKKYLLGKFSHIMESNFYTYSLQLSAYSMMLQKLTGRNIGTLRIIYIPPNNPLAFKEIYTPYLKNDAQLLFDCYKEMKHIKSNEEEKIVVYPNINKEQEIMPNFG